MNARRRWGIATLTFAIGATAPAAAADCLGDTTGPFTPYVCVDETAPSVSLVLGPAHATAASGEATVVGATVGHPLGETSVVLTT